MAEKTKKTSVFDSPVLSSKVKSLKTKIFPEGAIGYFIGPVLAIVSNSVMNQYLNRYYTDILGLTSWASLFSILLPIVSVIFVVLGNILVGKFMDRSKTKAGKARPLLLIALPLIVIALLFTFWMPSSLLPEFHTVINNNGQPQLEVVDGFFNVGTLIWVAVAYNLYYALSYPFYYTSHSALVNLSTRNRKDRSLLATISNATALAAMGLTSMVLPFLLKMFLLVEGEDQVLDIERSVMGWKIFMLVLAILTACGILLEYYFTRERVTEEEFASRETSLEKNEDGTYSVPEKKKVVKTSEQFKAVCKDKFWWFIIAFYFLYQLGGMLKNNSQMYFCQAFYGYETGQDLSGTISIVGAIPTALGMLVVWPLSNKIGKAKAILFGAILSTLGGLLGFIAPGNFALVLTSFVIKSLGSTPAMYISLALLGDMLDHNEAKHGFRSDGLTMTIYGSIMIGMSGLANGIINGCLSAVGYQPNDAWINSNPSFGVAMEFIFLGGETLCYFLIFILMCFMNVEKYSEEDKKIITERQKQACLEQGLPWIEPEERLRLEQEEFDRKNEEDRINSLKAKCAKKGLNFEEEEAKYQAQLAEKKRIAEEKKAEKERIKAEKQALKAKKNSESSDDSENK